MRCARLSRLFPALAFASLIAACNDSLALKDEIKARVSDSLTMLELTDLSSGARIRPGDTVLWPDTAYTETTQKIFRLANKGDSTVSLVGPAPVTISGGCGQAAFADGIGQPGLSTLPPGISTEFTLSFNPGTPDAYYSCTVVLGSDDPELPGYSFVASGRSTQWHGSKVISDISENNLFISPHLHIDGNIVYATYASSSAGAIKIRRSSDGGLNWGNAFGGQFAGIYPHLTAMTSASATSPGLHIMYYNSNQVSYNKNLNGIWRSNILTRAATAG